MGKLRPPNSSNLSEVTQLGNGKAGIEIRAVLLEADAFPRWQATWLRMGELGFQPESLQVLEPKLRGKPDPQGWGSANRWESGNPACGAELREGGMGFKGTQRWRCGLRSECAGFEVLIVPTLSFTVPSTFGVRRVTQPFRVHLLVDKMWV